MEIQQMVSVIARLSIKKAELDAAVRKMSRQLSKNSPPLKAVMQELSMTEWDLANFQRDFSEMARAF